MSEIGKKMFTGGIIGATAGTLAGGIYGSINANHAIEELPVDTVKLGAYDKPVFETKTIKVHHTMEYSATKGQMVFRPHTHTRHVDYPVMNPDGTVKMEQVPPRDVSNHGVGVEKDISHDIIDPKSGNKVGTWTEKTAEFSTPGVSVTARVLGYAALGAVAGGFGGALVTLALDKAGVV